MKWAGTAGTALVAELAAHFLSLTWGFAVLVLAFVWVASLLRVTTAKASSTESRVNALVPAVGAVKDTADYASGRADSAYTNAGNAQSTANSANSTANSAYSLASGAVQSGDYWGGTFRADAVHAAGDIQADSYMYCYGIRSSEMGAVAHPDATIASCKQAIDGMLNRL